MIIDQHYLSSGFLISVNEQISASTLETSISPILKQNDWFDRLAGVHIMQRSLVVVNLGVN